MLRATTACNFSSLIWPAGSAPAALASLLFDPLRSHKSLEKHSVSRLSYLFAHLHLLSSDLFSSDSFHLCFSTVHIVGSFTSKLPSTIETQALPQSFHVISMRLLPASSSHFRSIQVISKYFKLFQVPVLCSSVRSCPVMILDNVLPNVALVVDTFFSQWTRPVPQASAWRITQKDNIKRQ